MRIPLRRRNYKIIAMVLIALGLAISISLMMIYASKKPEQRAAISSVEQPDEEATQNEPRKIDKISKESTNISKGTTNKPKQNDQPKEKPKVLSTQEYGEKYLNLSHPDLQKCFDTIVEAFPHRFTEDVRENNVKALRAWSSVCATEVYRVYPGAPAIRSKGLWLINDDFFDGDTAKSYH